MNVTVPVININGTDVEELLKLNREADEALETAIMLMRKAVPHGRDYPRGPEEYRKAHDEFYKHLAMVLEAKSYMMAVAVAIYDQKWLIDENKKKGSSDA